MDIAQPAPFVDDSGRGTVFIAVLLISVAYLVYNMLPLILGAAADSLGLSEQQMGGETESHRSRLRVRLTLSCSVLHRARSLYETPLAQEKTTSATKGFWTTIGAGGAGYIG